MKELLEKFNEAFNKAKETCAEFKQQTLATNAMQESSENYGEISARLLLTAELNRKVKKYLIETHNIQIEIRNDLQICLEAIKKGNITPKAEKLLMEFKSLEEFGEFIKKFSDSSEELNTFCKNITEFLKNNEIKDNIK